MGWGIGDFKIESKSDRNKARDQQKAGEAASEAALEAMKESPEQKLLNQELLAQIKQMREEQDMFRPDFYRSMGYELVTNPDGTKSLRKLSDEERYATMSPDEQSSYTLQKLANERSIKAMKGELDLDPALEADITREQDIAKEGLYRQLGEGAEQTTAGQRRLAELAARANALRSQARHGELTTAEAISQNRGNRMAEIAGRYQSLATPSNSVGAASNVYGTMSNVRLGEARNKLAENQLDWQKKYGRMNYWKDMFMGGGGGGGGGGVQTGMDLYSLF